jgi:ubiquinone/menaquinone biosynthesis C-methylase UbiE
VRSAPDTTELNAQSVDLETAEAPVQAFFDQHASHYERSWDTREHGLNIGIFNGSDVTKEDDGLEAAYQRSRDHVVELLERMQPIGESARVLDVCCGTAVTLSQITNRHNCRGVGVDISVAQLEHAARLRLTSDRRGDLVLKRGSASMIAQVLKDEAPFTHAFSQEGLLFADDKPAAIRGLFHLLAPGGALVISDFVPQVSKEEIDASLRARVYEDVKWANGLTFQQYLNLLKEAGFHIVQAELRPLDMRMTYEKLIPRTQAMVEEDQAYAFLAKRYGGIVKAVHDGALTWAWFAARKP